MVPVAVWCQTGHWIQVPGRHPDRDGGERWQVCAGVDVDSPQLPDLVTIGVNNVVARPLPDIAYLEHARALGCP